MKQHIKFMLEKYTKQLRWFFKLSVFIIILHITDKIYASGFNWMDIDWYIRFKFPNLYLVLSRNIFHIFSVATTFVLTVYSCINFQFNYTLLILFSIHAAYLLGVMTVLQVWFSFLVLSYIFIGMLEFMRLYSTGSKKDYMKYLKLSTCFVILCYYHTWNYNNNEPYTYFVRTPDFIPSPLCNVTNQQVNFDRIFNEFVRHQERMMSLKTPINERKALILVSLHGGLGNRIQSLLSSFLLAILLKRSFFIDWYRNYRESYAALSELFEEPDFIWDVDAYFSAEITQFRSDSLRKEYDETDAIWIPYCRLCPFRSYPKENEIYDKLLCKNDLGFNSSKTIISVKSTQWFAPVLAHNPFFREKICEIMGPDLFGQLFRKLIKPKKKIMIEINKLLLKFKQSDRVIGVQIRSIEGNAISEEQLDVFLRCAKSLSLGASNPKFYISTDSNQTRDYAANLLGIEKVIVNNGSLDRNSVDGMKNALIDLWLLGEAHEIIISPYSTFGYAAHGRTSKIPYVVTRNNQCVKMMSSQPCFQYWFGVTMTPCFKKEMLTLDMLNQEDCWT